MSFAALLFSGCTTLPSNGPTAHQMGKGARASQAPLQFQITPIDPAVTVSLRQQDNELASRVAGLAKLASISRVDTIGPGDALTIDIFEVGVALFSDAPSRSVGSNYDPSAHGETFQEVTVDARGAISLPYVGTIAVRGLTPTEAGKAIDRALAKQSQSPQALVVVKKNISNTAIVSGDVRKPGRIELTLNRETLLDVIAEAGGTEYSAEDTIVRFARGEHILDERLGFIRPGSPDDLVLAAGDRVELIKSPRTFTVFGAVAKAQQINFETGAVSLAEAIARSQGPADASADASAIYLIRFDEVPDSPDTGAPRIYRLNMLQPASYLLAQRINVRDKDVIYFANAASNQPSKLVAILNQLFSPVVTARYLTQ